MTTHDDWTCTKCSHMKVCGAWAALRRIVKRCKYLQAPTEIKHGMASAMAPHCVDFNRDARTGDCS